MRVTVVDSGMGNLHSVVKALRAVGADVTVSADPASVTYADRLVLPGVGAFAENVKALVSRDLWNPVAAYLRANRPFLGICVGMQLLLDESEEFGSHKGFGVIPGKVKRLKALKVPQVGWNEVYPRAVQLSESNSASWWRGPHPWEGTPLQDLTDKLHVYFVHSYAAYPSCAGDVLATARIENPDDDFSVLSVTAAVRRGNVWGTQFHPEKSGEVGLAILKRWVNE